MARTPRAKYFNALSRRDDFVRFYLESLNAADAARRAGYSVATARAAGYKLLHEPEVAAAIKAARDQVATAQELNFERLIRELKGIALLDPRALYDWGPDAVVVKPSTILADSEARAVSGAVLTITPAGRTVKLSVHDKPAAISGAGQPPTGLTGTSANALILADQGDAKLLEVNGTAATAALEYVRYLRALALRDVYVPVALAIGMFCILFWGNRD